MGINRSLNRKVVQGPWVYQGLELDSIYLVQGTAHIKALQSHGKADTITGRLMRAAIKQHKLELGTGVPLFSQTYSQFKDLVTPTWISHT